MISRNQFLILLLFLLAGCNSKPFKYDELSFGEFSAIIFSNETYVAMQQPCKSLNLREQNELAVSCYQSVARDNPDSPEAQYLLAIAYAYGNNAVKTKEQALIIEKQSLNFLRLTLHVVAHMDSDFIEAFGVERRWLRKA